MPPTVRTALRPRMVALLVLALGLAALFAELGSWQLGRARSGAEPPPERAVVPLTSVLAPQQPLDAGVVAGPVSATGTYQGTQVLVTGRGEDGGTGDGAWVVAPLEVSTSGGPALLPVVRGWVPGPGAEVPPAPTGVVDVEGEMAVSEVPQGVQPGGTLRAASSADLVNVWDGDVYAGYLVQTGPAAASGLVAVPAPERESGPRLQNLSYAFQWWVFATFAVLMWWRVVRDTRRRELEAAEDAAADEAPLPQPPVRDEVTR